MINDFPTMDFPQMKRRWDVTIFRNEKVDGGVANTIVEQFQNVRSKWITGNVVDHEGVLHFVDEGGKEVVVSSVPFMAKEIAPVRE
jgi:hypothetical protein